MNPIIVESNFDGNKYLLIDGERRYRCCVELDLTEIPVTIITGPLTVEQRTIKRFHIQLEKSDWNEIEKARAIFEYKKNTNKTIAVIAEELNMHPPTVHGYLSLTTITEKGQHLLTNKNIDFTYLIYLVRIVKKCQKITNLTQEDIEISIFSRVNNKSIKTAADAKLLSELLSSTDNTKEVIKFITDKTYCFDDFILTFDNITQKKIKQAYQDSIKFLQSLKQIKTEDIPDEMKSILNDILKEIKK